MKTDFLLPVMLLCATDSYALDWLFEPDFNFKERYEDNVTMQINDSSMIRSMISTISPGVLLGYIADDNELKTRFKWNELIYHDASDLDFSEKILDVSHQYQADWFKTNLDASYYEESSINTQLVDPTNNIAGTTLIPRTTRSISPSATINLTARNSLQLAYSYLDVTFDRPPTLQNLSYSDYTNQQYSASAIHSYSERLSFNLTSAYSEFESSGNQESDLVPGILTRTTTFTQKSRTINFQAGLQYAFDEQTQLALSAGARNTETEATQAAKFRLFNDTIASPPTNQSSNTTGHIFSASLIRNGEWGNFSLNAGQQLNPASSGSQQQTTSFSGLARYNLSERWSTGINASYLISESTSTFDNSTNSFNRTYITVSPNIQWRWTPEMNLQLSYTYRQQEYTDRNQTAVGNIVQLQFSYQPQINRQVK
ncbi:MAG: hypothetical protein ACXV7J_10555 [Methylomonas sp.]